MGFRPLSYVPYTPYTYFSIVCVNLLTILCMLIILNLIIFFFISTYLPPSPSLSLVRLGNVRLGIKAGNNCKSRTSFEWEHL